MQRSPRPARRPSGLAAALAAAALAAACSAGSDGRSGAPEPAACPGGLEVPAAEPPVPPAAPARAADPVAPGGPGLDLVALLPRTGDLAFLGGATTAAVELAVADVNEAGGVLGSRLRLAHADSAEGTPGAAEAALAEHLAAGADAVVGPLSSAVAGAVLDQVAAAGAVLVTPGATASALDTVDRAGRLFRTVATEALQGRALAELVLDDGFRRVGLVVRADDHGRAVAGGFEDGFEAGDGEIAHRIDRTPTDGAVDLGPLAGDGVDAVVLVGLADTAPVLDALVGAGRAPADRPTYGTDGNLGDRLGDLVADRASLACLRGLLATAPADDDLAGRIARRLDAGASADRLDLAHAAEAYDAVAVLALAAEAAGTTDAAAVAAALPGVTTGGRGCHDLAACLAAVRRGADVAHVGRSGTLALDAAGNRTAVTSTFAAFGPDGRLVRIGPRRTA